jgi:hypothetical protein
VYGWLEQARPLVFVLTDGSGSAGAPRLNSTTKILRGVGASPGTIYGRFTDLDLYAALLGRDFGLFERLTAELAEAFVREGIEYVAGDAAEGYNPVHDACRAVIDAAAELASRASGRRVVSRDFLLFRRHIAAAHQAGAGAVRITLDDAQLARKLSTAREYPELRGEIEAMLDNAAFESLRPFPELNAYISEVVTSNMGPEAYRVECLRVSARLHGGAGVQPAEVPFYERYGEMLVAKGVYDQVIRYVDHLVPLEHAIGRFVDAKV